MSITRLQQARQMYAMGQRVGRIAFGGGGTMGASDRGYQGGPTGPSGPPGSDNSGPVDRSSKAQTAAHNAAVASAQDYNRAQNEKNRTMFGFQKPPSVLSTIGGRIGDYITGGGLIGAGIRGITGLVDRFTGPKAVDYNDGYNMANIAGPVVGPTPTEGGDGGNLQGIMATYTPNMLDTAEEDVAGGEIDTSMSDFLQRYRVNNPYRQDKQGQLDPAIIEMINKLYT
jgi:hypothetical protein